VIAIGARSTLSSIVFASRLQIRSVTRPTVFSLDRHRLYPAFLMSGKAFWLRCEKKEFERRSALTPTTAKKLIDQGFEIFVERDEQRIFDDGEYEA
jgi:hypothetical protein